MYMVFGTPNFFGGWFKEKERGNKSNEGLQNNVCVDRSISTVDNINKILNNKFMKTTFSKNQAFLVRIIIKNHTINKRKGIGDSKKKYARDAFI